MVKMKKFERNITYVDVHSAKKALEVFFFPLMYPDAVMPNIHHH